MKNHNLVLLFTAGVLMAAAASAEEKAGSVTTKLLMAQAYQDNGSPAPQKDAACTARYEKLFQQEVVNQYAINTQTLIMSATATFEGVPTQLFPMGLSNVYAFMSDGIPPELQKTGLMRIIFQLDKSFAMPRNMLMFPLEAGFNCVLTNGLLDAEAARALLTGTPRK